MWGNGRRILFKSIILFKTVNSCMLIISTVILLRIFSLNLLYNKIHQIKIDYKILNITHRYKYQTVELTFEVLCF